MYVGSKFVKNKVINVFFILCITIITITTIHENDGAFPPLFWIPDLGYENSPHLMSFKCTAGSSFIEGN